MQSWRRDSRLISVCHVSHTLTWRLLSRMAPPELQLGLPKHIFIQNKIIQSVCDKNLNSVFPTSMLHIMILLVGMHCSPSSCSMLQYMMCWGYILVELELHAMSAVIKGSNCSQISWIREHHDLTLLHWLKEIIMARWLIRGYVATLIEGNDCNKICLNGARHTLVTWLKTKVDSKLVDWSTYQHVAKRMIFTARSDGFLNLKQHC